MNRLSLFLVTFLLAAQCLAQTLLEAPGAAIIAKKKVVSGGGGGDINTALTHHYKFDENTGLTAVDSVGGVTYLGTFHGVGGDTSWAPAKIGVSSVGFDGSSAAAGVTLATLITVPSACTYATWFWPSNDASGSYQALISQDGSHGIYFHGSGGGVGTIDLFVGSDHFTTTTIATNGWHQLTLTVNSTAVNVYLDGVLDAGSPYSISAPFNVAGFGSDAGTGSEGFRGRMDDTLTYSRVLVQADVTALFNSTTGPTP